MQANGHAKFAMVEGASASETLLLILPSFFYLFLAVLLSSLISAKQQVNSFLLEFLVIVVPIILNVTVLAEYVTQIIIFTYVLITFTLFYILTKPTSNIKPKQSDSFRKDYITNVRSTINLISVIAILAVDFNVFPSRFSKTQKTGFSLMDVGVGLYVFANGIVAPEIKGRKDPIKRSLKSSAILLFIGIGRLFLTKATDYHVSVLEYGVHWNFFITLAATKILTSFILNVVNIKYVYLNAIALTLAHETLLEMSLKSIVFSDAKRDNFFLANKEGLVSTVGYITLYLYALYFGYSINNSDRNKLKTNLKFCLSTISCLALTYFCAANFEVSRRLANAGYIFWILFIGIFMMWLFYLGENFEKLVFNNRLAHYVCSPYIFEAINYNGLAFFLVGNVLTGLINLSINTRHVDPFYSLVIISIYMFVNCSTVYILYVKQIKLKL